MVAIVGRPNVGKSTLLNRLVGQKVSITSRKAQTTRHRITGILTDERRQFIFVDTPGFQTAQRNALSRMMNRTVRAALGEVDAVLFVVEAGKFSAADEAVQELLPEEAPVVLVINKADFFADRKQLLPFVAQRAAARNYVAIVPVSARTGDKTGELLDAVAVLLPEQPAIFSADDLTDRNERFLVSELIREKVFRLLGAELPYGCTVVIDQFVEEPVHRDPGARFCRIEATLLVARASHKSIVIGAAGAKLREIGTEARRDIEQLLGARVHLGLWVKVKAGWADDEARLKTYGYE